MKVDRRHCDVFLNWKRSGTLPTPWKSQIRFESVILSALESATDAAATGICKPRTAQGSQAIVAPLGAWSAHLVAEILGSSRATGSVLFVLWL
eukprot:CAMPEP_0183550450 /NCGR_PEP_ID=MMETSP0371-20130417/64698_1 /TAXON_ID=268820 /ORGANISM="Peridinium aciculiferum, Strain PAER-2" /LENGTH=92 /DNA_ID=CAMNT_0025754587 /DNA_START=82 /DNA_END=357 /DNA_ORIENTATION=-